ncbi:MAG: hypothetical protein IKN55_13365, partial [Oscillospiraceae bacterium]|nr:hypothetical protein [Oscillospiraceae bacterium]
MKEVVYRSAFFTSPTICKVAAGKYHARQIALNRSAGTVVGTAGAMIKGTANNRQFCRTVCCTVIIL